MKKRQGQRNKRINNVCVLHARCGCGGKSTVGFVTVEVAVTRAQLETGALSSLNKRTRTKRNKTIKLKKKTGRRSFFLFLISSQRDICLSLFQLRIALPVFLKNALKQKIITIKK